MSETAARPVDTVTIEIDGKALTAPKGAMIIQVADEAGITIPRFCYHEKLSIAANCRMCLVDVEKAPKPLPACATPVMDGMKVYTQSKRALSAQQNVMEFLLINHPLDCPICDQGGECELQDLSMGFGRSVARFSERKRVVKDENLGSLIATDMTRCIHCTRCVRFLEEIAGTSELGGMGRGETMSISTFIGRSIDSELSGNVIDVCPVGALTNKPFRFAARAWELRARAAVANHDPLGSNLYYHQLRGRILRAVPRDNEEINESWLSDRDRWGFHGLYADDRAKTPLIKRDGQWHELGWPEALDQAAAALRAVAGDELGVLLSPNASNEELYLAQKLARALGCHHVDHRLRQLDFDDQDGFPLHPGLGRAVPDLSRADALFLVGANVRHDAPILGHNVRQAWRRGARVYALAARGYDSHFDLAQGIVARPSAWAAVLAGVAKALGVKAKGKLGKLIAAADADDAIATIAGGLKDSERATILLGAGAVDHRDASILRALASACAESTGAHYAEMPAGANGAGAWSVGALPHRLAGGAADPEPGLNAQAMLERPRRGYLIYDFEPELDHALGARAGEVLAAAETVVYLGAFASEPVRRLADLILPLAVLPEVEGSLTNAAGTTQVSAAAGTPPDDARPGWKVLRALGGALEAPGFEHTRIEQVREEIAAALSAGEPAPTATDCRAPAESSGDALEVLVEVPIYGCNAMVRRSRALQDTVHGEPGRLRVHPDDLERAGAAAGRVRVSAGETTVEVEALADASVAPGCVIVPAGCAATAALVGLERLELEPAGE